MWLPIAQWNIWRKIKHDEKTKTVTVVLTAIYCVLVAWIILLKMSTFSQITFLDDLRSVNWIPFHYDVEHPYNLTEKAQEDKHDSI